MTQQPRESAARAKGHKNWAKSNAWVRAANDPVLGCKLNDPGECPVAQGYGLGWELFDFGDRMIVSHGGSDWSERAMVYFDPDRRDGIILFLNGPADTSVDALIEGMRLLDPGSRLATLYAGWVEAWRKAQPQES